MAHLIDNSKGFNAFVSHKEKPWHGLGKVVQTELTTEEALRYGGLDYQVNKAPNVHTFPDGTHIVSDKSFFTFRDDTKAVLGAHVGAGYTPLQNGEAFYMVDDFVKLGKGTIETAGALNGGATTFLTIKPRTAFEVAKGDEIEQYVLFANSHDGTKAVTAMYTPIRVVCNNTLQMAFRGATNAISVRHTKTVKSRTESALQMLNVFVSNEDILKANAERLIKQQMHEERFKHIICNLFGVTQSEALATLNDADGGVSTRSINLMRSMYEFAQNGIGQAMAGEGTSWWAYNAITGYFSHEHGYRGEEAKMQNIMFGNTRKTMEHGLELCLAPELVKPVIKEGSQEAKQFFNLIGLN